MAWIECRACAAFLAAVSVLGCGVSGGSERDHRAAPRVRNCLARPERPLRPVAREPPEPTDAAAATEMTGTLRWRDGRRWSDGCRRSYGCRRSDGRRRYDGRCTGSSGAAGAPLSGITVNIGGTNVPKENVIAFINFGHSNMAGRGVSIAATRPYFFGATDPHGWMYHSGLGFQPAVEPKTHGRGQRRQRDQRHGLGRPRNSAREGGGGAGPRQILRVDRFWSRVPRTARSSSPAPSTTTR